MSSALARPRRAAGRLLVELYPEAWRARYGEEIRALVDDDPPAVRGLASLLRGAADAHLHPQPDWRAGASPIDRMRLSIGAIFGCWIAVSLAGAGFQKETEESAFRSAERAHWPLALAHDAVLAGAVLGSIAIAIGGLPLLARALRQACAQRDIPLARLLALAPGAVLCFLALTWALVALAPGARGPEPLAIATLMLWWLAGLACALTCAITPPRVLRRTTLRPRALRRASLAGVALTFAIGLIAAALTLYTLALVLLAPRLAADSGGPLWPSTASALAATALLAGLSTAVALLSAERARRARAEAR